MIGSVIVHSLENHIAYRALNSKQGENTLKEIINSMTKWLSFVQPWMVITGAVVFTILLIVWNLVGKGRGSHAGREEVRRSYRRALAREMAKQDAEKIKIGEKPRRRWMQW